MIDTVFQAIQSQATHTAEVMGYATVAIAVFEHYTGVGPKNLTGKWQLVPALVLTIAGLFAFALDARLPIGLAIFVALVNGSLAGYGANLTHRCAQVVGGKGRRSAGPPPLRGASTLFVLLTLTACAGSFEEAKLAGVSPQARAAAAPPSARCQSLDSQHRVWGAVGKGAAVLAGAEGLSTIATDDATLQTGLAIGALATGAISATAVYVSEDAATSWARECQ